MTEDLTPPSLVERARAAEPALTRSLVGRLTPAPASELRELADAAASLDEPGAWDRYGEHGPVAALERRVADLLGTPAAAMFPSGVMAQQSILRVWCDAGGSRRVAIPALSHLLKHESDGPRLLHGFEFALLTDGPTVPQVEHLEAVRGRLGAALLELPLRDAGYLLPSWDELVAFSRACRERGVPLHLDGARIWESAPRLGHPGPRSRPWPTASTSRSTRGSEGWPVLRWRGRRRRWRRRDSGATGWAGPCSA